MLKRLKYGKEFERLFAEYYNRMYYRAYHYVNDTEISKDIVSDAFGYVWEHYEALRKIDCRCVPAMYWKSVIFTGKNMQKWPKILELVLMP